MQAKEGQLQALKLQLLHSASMPLTFRYRSVTSSSIGTIVMARLGGSCSFYQYDRNWYCFNPVAAERGCDSVQQVTASSIVYSRASRVP